MNILTNKWAYYNEINPDAAQWIRNLIKAGLVAPGEVDERSIEDVLPSDVRGFIQCHWFAGVAVWSYALRKAGWPDDRAVWTGSCPCQPFSSAGKGAGFKDPRHLWPAFYHLIKECKPPSIFGEQVASKTVEPWIDLVQLDLEALGYAFGCVPFPSSSVGAPHIRQRLYWVGHASSAGLEGHAGNGCPAGREGQKRSAAETSVPSGLADADGNGCQPRREGCEALGHWQTAGADRSPGGMADAQHDGRSGPQGNTPQQNSDRANIWLSDRGHIALEGQPATGPTNGFWADADWLFCRDGKWRPVEPGTFPLVNGMPASMGAMSPELQRLAELAGLSKDSLKRGKKYRVEALRGYGNAINAVQAQAFIEVAMEVMA